MTYDIHEYVRTTREHFASYHNHKEQMAFTATGLYIGGITALLAQAKLDWVKSLSTWIWLSVVILLAVVVILFVFWQLGLRELAARIIEACDNLRTLWLSGLPANITLTATRHDGIIMPKILADELSVVAQNRVENQKRARSKWLTLAIIVLWSVFLLLRIWFSS